MSGHQRKGATFIQSIQHSLGQRRSFQWIGSRSQFIEKHQATTGRMTQDRSDHRDMSGEGRKILLQTLLIADIGQNRIKDGNFSTLRSGHRNSRGGHQREQADRLEHQRLAARVGTGDHHLIASRIHREGHRHHL